LKKQIFTLMIVFLVNICTILAQKDTLSGVWEGVLTVENEGQVLTEYEVAFLFSKEKDYNEGFSTIYYKNIRAILFFEAQRIDENTLNIKELRIQEASELPNGEWCIKNIFLKKHYENNTLIWKGEWNGKTSFSTCLPGKIWLKKGISRA
jgi:hypothetical protein